MTPTAVKVLDFALLQAGWFACVLGAARGYFWLGPAVVVGAVSLHMLVSPRPERDARTLLPIVLLGVSTDLIQEASGVLAFPGPAPRLGPLPLWIVVLWPLFGVNFHTTLAWLHDRLGLAALLGAVGGPPGYVAAGAGALEFTRPLEVAIPALSAAWAVILPVGVLIARHNARSEVQT